MTARAALSLALPLSLLAGCAGDKVAYPSLAPRAAERVEMTVPAESPAPAAPLVSAPQTDVGAIIASAQSADTAFRAKLAAMRPAIEAGRSAAMGSEKWVVAQQAYSDADIARGPIGSALADLDHLHQQSVESGDTRQQAAVEAATEQVQALNDAAQAAIAPLQPATE